MDLKRRAPAASDFLRLNGDLAPRVGWGGDGRGTVNAGAADRSQNRALNDGQVPDGPDPTAHSAQHAARPLTSRRIATRNVRARNPCKPCCFLPRSIPVLIACAAPAGNGPTNQGTPRRPNKSKFWLLLLGWILQMTSKERFNQATLPIGHCIPHHIVS